MKDILKNKVFINDIKMNLTDGGFACGPIDGSIIVSIQYSYNNETKWLTCVEFDSMPDFYLSSESIIESIDENDIDIYDKLKEKYGLIKFGEVELSSEYDDLFENIYNDLDSIEAALLRVVILLIRCDYEDLKPLESLLKSKDLNSLILPISDVEQDFLDEHK